MRSPAMDALCRIVKQEIQYARTSGSLPIHLELAAGHSSTIFYERCRFEATAGSLRFAFPNVWTEGMPKATATQNTGVEVFVERELVKHSQAFDRKRAIWAKIAN